jgi:hypothetical protein
MAMRNRLRYARAFSMAQAAAAEQQVGEKAQETPVNLSRCLHAVEPAVISMTAG